MKNVCFLMYSPFTIGGEQRVVTILANELVKNNVNVTFLLLDKFKRIDYSLYNMDRRIKIYFLDKYNKTINRMVRKTLSKIKELNSKIAFLNNNLLITKQLYCNSLDRKVFYDFFKNNQFDCVIGVSSENYGILTTLNKNLPLKKVAWQHSSFESYFKTKGRRFYNQNKFVKYLFKNIDEYVVQTNSDKSKIKKEYNYDCTVINNPNSFENIKETSNLKNKRFIAAGRMASVKQFDHIIKAFIEFAKNDSEWTLTIYAGI